MKENTFSLKDKIIASLKILGVLWVIGFVAAIFLYGSQPELASGNVAVIPLHGVITSTTEGGFSTDYISADQIIRSLDKADKNPNIRAILLDINSPGGSPVGTDEISQKLKSINKTKIAVIREVGASGAYWVATSTDYIFANRMSVTGSIGVIGSYLEFSGLLNRYNVTYERFVSGELKDMGSPFKAPSEQDRIAFQSLIDKMREIFVQEVSANRHLPLSKVDRLATGEVFLGTEAQKLGLVDAIGTKQDALDYIGARLNISADPVDFREKKSLADLLAEFSSMLNPKIGNFINSAAPNPISLR